MYPLNWRAALAREVTGIAGANRLTRCCVLPILPVFDISGVRRPVRGSCGPFCAVPSWSRALRSTETDPAFRCACAVVAKANAAVREANTTIAMPRGETAARCRINLEAIIFNPNNVSVSKPDSQAKELPT